MKNAAQEKIKDANARDFRLQYFRKGTLITSGSDPLRKLIFVKNGSCQVIRKVDQTRDRKILKCHKNVIQLSFWCHPITSPCHPIVAKLCHQVKVTLKGAKLTLGYI